MTKKEKEAYINKKTIGYWSALSGLEVKEIIHGIEDYCICVSGAWCGNYTVHKAIIHYETERPYIKIKGIRFHFDECIKN